MYTFADFALDSNLMLTMVQVVAYIAPFFLIPAAFKAGMGAFNTLTGMLSDRSRGFFDGQRKRRQETRAQNRMRRQNYGLFSDRNKVGRGLNTFYGATANPRQLARGRAGIDAGKRQGRALLGGAEFENDATIKANQNNDNFLLALANRNLAQRKLEAAQASYAEAVRDHGADSSQAISAQQEILARQSGLQSAAQVRSRNSRATQQQALMSLAKTGYQFSDGEEGYKELQSTVAGIAGGDLRAQADMMDEAQFHLKGSGGRFDLGGINHGSGYSAKAGTNKASLYELANAKEASIRALTSDFLPASGPIAPQHLDDAAVAYMELQAMLPNSKGSNRDEILKQIDRLETQGGMEAYLQTGTGNIDPATGAPKLISMGGGRTRPETMRDVLSRRARTYEKPDPNRT